VLAVERPLIAADISGRHDGAENVVSRPVQADVARQSAGLAHLRAQTLEVPVDRVIRVRHPVERAARIELLEATGQLREQVNEGGAIVVAESLARAALLVELELAVGPLQHYEV